MPADSAKDSFFFVPLSYYKLTVPVIPLPNALNDEARRDGSDFLEVAEQRHERFLALAHSDSYETLDWLSRNASNAFVIHEIGTFDEVKVLEFTPLPRKTVQ
jgi:hypothetical protein